MYNLMLSGYGTHGAIETVCGCVKTSPSSGYHHDARVARKSDVPSTGEPPPAALGTSEEPNKPVVGETHQHAGPHGKNNELRKFSRAVIQYFLPCIV